MLRMMFLHSETYIDFCETERIKLAFSKCPEEEMCKDDMNDHFYESIRS